MPLALLLVLLAPAPDAGAPPKGLRCLTRHYAGAVSHRPDAGWGLLLEGGVFIPWRAEAPPADAGADVDDEGPPGVDLESIYRPPYVAGPIRPVDTSDAGAIEDPGRVRVEQLFFATYGASREEVFERMARVRFFGLRYPFHALAAEPLRRVVARLEPQVQQSPALRRFVTDIGGTFAWRKIARSRNLSTHAFGIAIDLNVARSHYWRWTRRGEPLRWQNQVPQALVDAFEAEGFIWGGRWVHYDTMHFEYRPELLDPACRDDGDAGDAGVDGAPPTRPE